MRSTAALLGAVGAALAASACCTGPLVFALLGIGGAGFLVALEPYRPILTILTLSLLGLGYLTTFRRLATDDCGCSQPRAGRRALWAATGLVSLALLFPYLF
jgi:mercuric ion transport protein